MADIEDIFKSFKSGELDKIFIFIYSYFILGYLILFTTYEKSFLDLNFSTQIILSIGISFPIILMSSIIFANRNNKKRDHETGLFFQLEGELVFVSLLYSILFSFLYLVNHSVFSWSNNPTVASGIIILVFIVCWIYPKAIPKNNLAKFIM